MSTTAPPASGPRPAPNHPSATTSAPAPCAPALLPAAGIALGEELGGDALDAGAAHRPEVDVETMRSIHAQVRDLVRRESSVGAPGFRLVCVLEGDISWRDIRIDGPGYAVLGSHRGCDVVLARDRGIWRRHLAAICVPVEDGRVGLRLVGLATDQPFFLDDDTPRQAVLVRGSFAMRVGRHVICGFPIGERADIGSPSEFTLCPPVSQLGAVSSVGDVRVILVRGHVGAVVDLPAAAFDGGVLIGRALRCCDEGLRRVCGDAISRGHVLIVRVGGDMLAFDLCSSNGTREAGVRVRRARLRGAAPRLQLGKDVILTIALPGLWVGGDPHADIRARVPGHPTFGDCSERECMVCGVRDCPRGDPLHYQQDGCPACGVDSPRGPATPGDAA